MSELAKTVAHTRAYINHGQCRVAAFVARSKEASCSHFAGLARLPARERSARRPPSRMLETLGRITYANRTPPFLLSALLSVTSTPRLYRHLFPFLPPSLSLLFFARVAAYASTTPTPAPIPTPMVGNLGWNSIRPIRILSFSSVQNNNSPCFATMRIALQPRCNRIAIQI